MARCVGSSITAFASQTGFFRVTRAALSSGRLRITRSRKFGCKGRETIAKSDGSHTPAIDYQIDDDWSATLTLEAEIHVRLEEDSDRRCQRNQC